jgi:hypothetical protein
MKKHIAAAGLALLALLTMANAQNNILVPIAPQPPPYYGLWTDTGTSLTNGEWININASGLWNISGPAASGNTPDGFFDGSSDLFYGDGIHGGMVAYIGSNPFQGEWSPSGGNYFFPQTTNYWQVGTSVQLVSPTNGELWLGFNDDAESASYSDNDGLAVATLSLGFSTNAASDPDLALSVAQVSSNSFSFYITNGIPLSICAVYDSSDLEHWTLIDSLLLDTNGSSAQARSLLKLAGTEDNPIVNGAYANTTGVPYRFYKVTDGQFISETIGYVRLLIGPGTTNSPGTNSLIANQFEAAAGNTLNGLFDPMADGTILPTGAQIMKWNATAYDTYTWNGTSWGGGGSVTMNPGEAAFLVNPTAEPITVTFAGLVEEGSLSLSIPNGQYSLISSMLPKAGGVQTTLNYAPHNNDQILIWGDGNYISHKYASGTGLWSGQEPLLQVGEGLFLNPSTNNVWLQNYSSRHF